MQVIQDLRLKIDITDVNTRSRDVKELVTASTPLLNMLTKMKSEITNMDSLSKMETATVDTIRTLSREAQEFFYAGMEKNLP